MMLRIWIPAALLFGTGVLTGLGVGRLQPLGTGFQPPLESPAPTVAAVDKPGRLTRTNSGWSTNLRTPGAGRLEQFKRALGGLQLEGPQREKVDAHFRETQDRLRALLKPLHPEAARELRGLRQQILAELSPEQRAQFERLSSGNGRPDRPRERPNERRE